MLKRSARAVEIVVNCDPESNKNEARFQPLVPVRRSNRSSISRTSCRETRWQTIGTRSFHWRIAILYMRPGNISM
jgi:hypothetical protein